MTDKKVIDRLNEIAALYDELAPGKTLDQPIATNRVPDESLLQRAAAPYIGVKTCGENSIEPID
jgi:hypothetical protein